ncbi:hypothetical protein Dimus_006912 [Dionaea muscipula]
MGNYRFRLSEIIPNAWFYKLKDFSTTKSTKTRQIHPKKKSPPPAPPQHQKQQHQKQQHISKQHSAAEQPQPHLSHSRKSYYFTRKSISQTNPEAPETFPSVNPHPPRKSAGKRPTKRKSTTTTTTRLPEPENPPSVSSSPDLPHLQYSSPEIPQLPPNSKCSSSTLPCSAAYCRCRVDPPLLANSDRGIVVAVNVESLQAKKRETSRGGSPAGRMELAPIIAKPEKFKLGISKEQRAAGWSVRRVSVSSPTNGNGVRVRLRGVNSPRIMSSNGTCSTTTAGGRRSSFSGSRRSRKSISESFAIVKSSVDPQRDFKESMVEMIMENDIKGSKELEDLLACYLSLNSNEYHDVIVKVFKQIWFDLNATTHATWLATSS